MQTVQDQLTIIERSAEVFKSGGKILKDNQDRSAKALAVGNNILQAIEANGGKLNEELDNRCQKFLANCTKALSEMKDDRAAVTQLMDELKKLYTEAENQLDSRKTNTIPAQIQQKRDAYAQQVAAEEKRKREEAEAKARLEKRKIEFKSAITTRIANCLINHITEKVQQYNASFNAITLENYNEKKEALERLATEFVKSKLGAVLNYEEVSGFSDLDSVLRLNLRTAAHEEYNFEPFFTDYKERITELKQSLLDRLPSKKAELDELKAQEEARERQRLADQEAARKREEERQLAIKKAQGEEKKRLKEAAEQAAAEELKRQQENQQKEAEEKLRREEEIKKRERDEQARIEAEAAEKKRKAEADIEMQKHSAQTMVLFNQEAEVSETAAKPETREGYEIVVEHPAAYVQIFQFWFEREGKNLPVDKIGKTTMNQMKAFCEKTAFKTAEKIESKLLRYVETFKAVNRKAS